MSSKENKNILADGDISDFKILKKSDIKKEYQLVTYTENNIYEKIDDFDNYNSSLAILKKMEQLNDGYSYIINDNFTLLRIIDTIITSKYINKFLTYEEAEAFANYKNYSNYFISECIQEYDDKIYCIYTMNEKDQYLYINYYLSFDDAYNFMKIDDGFKYKLIKNGNSYEIYKKTGIVYEQKFINKFRTFKDAEKYAKKINLLKYNITSENNINNDKPCIIS